MEDQHWLMMTACLPASGKYQEGHAIYPRMCGAAAAREQTLIAAGAGDAVSAPSCSARGMSPRGDENECLFLCDQSTRCPEACVA